VRKAEEILDIAAAGSGVLEDTAIVIDRSGGFRMIEAAGWTLSGIAAEYGAAAVYRVERRGGAIRVEGFDGSDRCLLQRSRPMGLVPAFPMQAIA